MEIKIKGRTTRLPLSSAKLTGSESSREVESTKLQKKLFSLKSCVDAHQSMYARNTESKINRLENGFISSNGVMKINANGG